MVTAPGPVRVTLLLHRPEHGGVAHGTLQRQQRRGPGTGGGRRAGQRSGALWAPDRGRPTPLRRRPLRLVCVHGVPHSVRLAASAGHDAMPRAWREGTEGQPRGQVFGRVYELVYGQPRTSSAAIGGLLTGQSGLRIDGADEDRRVFEGAAGGGAASRRGNSTWTRPLLYLCPPLTPDAARSGPRSAPSRPTPPRCGPVGCTSPYGRSARASRS